MTPPGAQVSMGIFADELATDQRPCEKSWEWEEEKEVKKEVSPQDLTPEGSNYGNYLLSR